jgi:hypothetical protein
MPKVARAAADDAADVISAADRRQSAEVVDLAAGRRK